MASSDSTPPLPLSSAPLPPKKENITPVGSKIAELNESRTELLNRIQGLKQDLKNWRSKLDTQVKIYRDELTELKKTLNVEVEQLRSEFQELRNSLHQQQEDVTASLRNLGKLEFAPRLNHFELLQLQDVSERAKEAEDPKVKLEGKDEETHTSPIKENGNEAKILVYLAVYQRKELSSESIGMV
ncbi:Uveal autoantigen with coiled-coil domain and ankyrin repeat isoform 2 [Gossypium australe]|uniref:Uveal autoantigen with coiled-coil domain and ankyrin repeat isoform 2 n=1 Tax=Gossypium australe TaxID=47621 RepID=A0A5B6WHM6_9ROSI|nr:Uveal autoantigen with coiled-coil domain and ankyrin repeat isoform 2 [Gossypium australe]